LEKNEQVLLVTSVDEGEALELLYAPRWVEDLHINNVKFSTR